MLSAGNIEDSRTAPCCVVMQKKRGSRTKAASCA
jgi:hypothetical protein